MNALYTNKNLEKEANKLLWYFEIQIDQTTESRQGHHLVYEKKRTCNQKDLTDLADHWRKVDEEGKLLKYLSFAEKRK